MPAPLEQSLAMPSDCQLYLVNRDALFSSRRQGWQEFLSTSPLEGISEEAAVPGRERVEVHEDPSSCPRCFYADTVALLRT